MAATLTTPEISYRQPDFIYRQADGISQSQATEILKSAAHYQARYGPGAPAFIPTPNMLVGSATHTGLLEPDDFASQWSAKSDHKSDFTIQELKDLLSEAGVEFKKSAPKAELMALAFPDGVPVDKRTKLADKDFESVLGMVNALRSHDLAGAWFDASQPQYRDHNEVSIRVRHPGGQLIKGRLDRVHFDGDRLLILDLKTTDDVGPGFRRKLVGLSYDLQAAWYLALAQQAWPEHNAEFVFCCVERSQPHGVKLYKAGASVIESGRRKMDRALELFSKCQAVDYWPGYSPEVEELEMPGWAEQLQEEEALI